MSLHDLAFSKNVIDLFVYCLLRVKGQKVISLTLGSGIFMMCLLVNAKLMSFEAQV